MTSILATPSPAPPPQGSINLFWSNFSFKTITTGERLGINLNLIPRALFSRFSERGRRRLLRGRSGDKTNRGSTPAGFYFRNILPDLVETDFFRGGEPRVGRPTDILLRSARKYRFRKCVVRKKLEPDFWRLDPLKRDRSPVMSKAFSDTSATNRNQ